MKRLFKKINTILGVVLSVALVLESSGITVLATEINVQIEDEIVQAAASDSGTNDGNEDVSGGDVITSGTYYGMDWLIDDKGHLTISGAYSNSSSIDDVSWHNAAELIVSAKVTATGVTNTVNWFNGLSNLKSVDLSSFDSSNVTDMNYMFNGCTALTSLDLSTFNTGLVKNMSHMFYNCEALTAVDVSGFNTEAVTNMYRMFGNCSSLKELDVSSFDTSNVTNMNSMFATCSELTELDVSKFNTEHVTDMSNMFFRCKKLSKLDVSNFNTSKVTTMHQMFFECMALENLDLSKFNTGLVTDMYGMFYNDRALANLNVSSFNTANVTNMNRMFWNCSALTSLDVSSFKTDKVTDMTAMFNTCSGLTELDLSGFDMSAVISADNMFYRCSFEQLKTPVNVTLDVVLPATYSNGNGTGYQNLPQNMTESIVLTKAIVAGTYCGMDWVIEQDGHLTIYGTFGSTADTDVHWNEYADQVVSAKITAKGVTDNDHWFNNMTKMKEVDLSEFDSSKVVTMNEMFYNCKSLTALDVTGFDTSKVTNMSDMFYGCSQLTELNISNFDMTAVTEAGNMLAKCDSLEVIQTPINVNIDIALPYYFHDGKCNGYAVLPKNKAESITLKKAIGGGIYQGLNWLVDDTGLLYISGTYNDTMNTAVPWTSYAEYITNVRVTATGVTSTSGWFSNLVNLSAIDLSGFDSSKITNMDSMFYNCSSLKELNLNDFNTDSVISMRAVFHGCSSLEKLNISSFNTSKVTTAEKMFYNCSNLTTLDLSNFDFTSLNNGLDMFSGCIKLGYINTPTNLNVNISLPVELENEDRDIYKSLPKGMNKSIVLTYVIYRIAEVEDQVYTGKAIKPNVTVYKGDKLLIPGVDYTISYKNNKNVGDKDDGKKAPTITVKGKNQYMGTITRTFTIKPKELTEENTVTAPTVVAQSKKDKAQTFKSSVVLNGKKLKLNKEYVIEYPDTKDGAYKHPGKYNVIIKGTGNYSGQIKTQLIVLAEEQIAASMLKVDKVPDCSYIEGMSATPEPTVSYKGKKLVLGADYALEYINNDRAGKASLIVRGLENVDGIYVTGSVTKTFVITGTDLQKLQINYADSAIYTGENICPEVTVTHGETKLRPGIDYTIEYNKNVNVGKGTITLKGCGGYIGTVMKTFAIVPDTAIADKLAIDFESGTASAYYTSGGVKPELLIRMNNKALKLGRDYTISYKNNKKIAAIDAEKTPTVIIKGKGNYNFTKEVPFAIVACPVSELHSSAQDKFLGDKKGYLSAPVLKDGKKKLKAGVDYTVIGYKLADGTEFKGTEDVANDTVVTVTVRGMGNYVGEQEITYRIATKSVAKLKITAKPLEYREENPVFYRNQDINSGLLVITDKATKTELKYGKDYKLVGYTNNLRTGTATVTIQGCGEYGGTRTVKFKIVQYKLQ